MRRTVDAYLVAYFIASLAIVVGFTAAGAVPPRWLLGAFLPLLLLALACVLWLGRRASSAEEIPPDRALKLTD